MRNKKVGKVKNGRERYRFRGSLYFYLKFNQSRSTEESFNLNDGILCTLSYTPRRTVLVRKI